MDKYELPMQRRKNGKAHFLVPGFMDRLATLCGCYRHGKDWTPTSYAIEMDAAGGKDICRRCLQVIERK